MSPYHATPVPTVDESGLCLARQMSEWVNKRKFQAEHTGPEYLSLLP